MRHESPRKPNRRQRWVSLSFIWLGFLSASSDAATLVSSFTAGNGSWQLGTLAVGNVDGSPDLEIVVPYRDASGKWFLDAFKYTGQRLPGFPYAAAGEPINVSPTLYDLNRDGREEILFTRGEHVIALRGDGSVLWSNTVNAASYVPNGGYQTVTNGFYWYPSGAWVGHLPNTAAFSSEVSPPLVMDLNGNGRPEVLTAWKILPDPAGGGQDYNPFIYPVYGVGQWGTLGEDWSGGVVTMDAATGQRTFVYHLHQLVEAGLAVGRATATGPLKIYALNDSDSVVCFDKSLPFGLWGKGMLFRAFGKNQQLMSGSYLVPIDVYTGDLDGDGLDEALVAGTQLSSLWQPNETILDHNGAILWRKWLPHLTYTNNFGWLNSACLMPCNPDHDNHVDVLGWNHGYSISFRYWNGIELVDRPGWPKSFYPCLPTPPVVGDVDGDGEEEIVIGTYNPGLNPSNGSLLIYALDGTLKHSVTVPGGLKHIPALADVEGSGRLDVVYRSLSGQVYVQNFGATGTNLVSWSTHRGNMRRDGNHGASLYPPGTPLVNRKVPGFRRATFGWTNATPADCYRIYRAERAEGPFLHLATATASANSYTDLGLKPGWLYFYEVGAVYGSTTVYSAPFAVLSSPNGNLLANSGFEENENSHWDKWFTGEIETTNMCVNTNVVFQGQRSMEIRLRNKASNSTIAQFNQYGIPDSTVYVTPGAFYSYGGYFASSGISSASEHWLEWSSTKTGYNTNSRPLLPDPFYYTPHWAIGTNPVGWTYVNRTFQLPAGFPNIELRHRYTVASPASGSVFLDSLFFRQIPSPSATNWTSLIRFGSKWHYWTNTAPGSWDSASFDDRGWPLANAKFGAGSGPTNVVTRLPQLLSHYYFRTRFNLTSTNIEELLLSATCTDASLTAIYPLRLFVNGQEVKSFIDAVTMQGNQRRYFDLTPFATFLQMGTNTLAVQLGNCWSDYDDVAFDLSLQAVIVDNSEMRCQLQVSGSSPLAISAKTPSQTVWQLQSNDDLQSGNWRLMEVFTNLTGTVLSWPDTGQNGRTPPESTAVRLYRLMPY